MTSVTFSVPWAFGWQRTKANFANGRPRFITPRETREREAEVAAAYMAASAEQHGRVLAAAKGEPVGLTVTVRRRLPESRPKRTATEPDTFKPDIDNCIKLVMDGLNGVAYADDAQVTSINASKLDRSRGAQDATWVTVLFND